jgi:hypothetical protein
MILDNWKEAREDVEELIKITNKSCFRLWNLVDSIVGNLDMNDMDEQH